MTLAENMASVVAAINANTYRFATEEDLQRGISLALYAADVPHEREVRLGPTDRIDFVAGDVGIEVKIDGSITPLTRQLHRYAFSGRIAGLVVVTSRMRLAVQMPRTLNDKPVTAVVVGGIA